MKIFKFMVIVGVLIGISACTGIPEISDSEEDGVRQELVIKATHEFDSQTKTVLQSDGSVWWKPDDAIGVFFGKRCYEFYSYNSENAPSANFVGSIIVVQGHNENSNGNISGPSYWGVFPPDLTNEYTMDEDSFDYGQGNEDYHTPTRDGESVNVYLPSRQRGVAGTFDSNNFISIAKSDTYDEMAFYNLCGGLAFCVERDDIYRVTFQGNANEVLAGSVNVVMDSKGHPVVSEVNAGKNVVEIAMPEGKYFKPGEWYYIVMLPTTLAEGYTMTFDTGNKVGSRVSSGPVEIKRSVFGGLTNPDKDIEYVLYGYVDGGVNYGMGIEIDGVVWAPVNCGYEPVNDDYKGYPYGKLYQWGRRYGQGYEDDYYNDATTPVIEGGGVSLQNGQSEASKNIFFTRLDYIRYLNWLYPGDDKLWNSGTEENPVKTKYDPCPRGWRVPTYSELNNLILNHSEWTTDGSGQSGYWFSGTNTYTEDVAQIFFPAAGRRNNDGNASSRGYDGCYYSSAPFGMFLSLDYARARMSSNSPALGCSVRCVLDSSGGYSEGDGSDDDDLRVPVLAVHLSHESLKLYPGYTTELTAHVLPTDAADKMLTWSSDNESVATVDQTGKVTGVSVGTATISATAGGIVSTCSVKVAAIAVATADYESYGKGTAIGGTVWAPVNCGYHPTDYKYGKLYQWGRKYGQGYYTDTSYPTGENIVEGPVSSDVGQSENNEDKFYISSTDWLDEQNDGLWNSGTEDNPEKTEYDPCPAGWRVPTSAELEELCQHHSEWTTDASGQSGYWFSGSNPYTEGVSQIFLPAAGYRSDNGTAINRGYSGGYWSSRPYHSYAYYLYFRNGDADMHSVGYRAEGYSVRCVQDIDEVAEL